MKKILLLFLFVSFFGFSQIEIETTNINSKNKEVSISVIEEIPLFKECEKYEKEKHIECFNEMIQNHIKSNFNYPILAAKYGIQGTVLIQFIIGKEGKITSITSKGHQLLTDEAERIIGLIPQLKPGKQRGKPVNVRYGLPITFKLQ
ncbi:energy transducer TonB [Flavobacterium sp.]|uniref:energy transducer TonB n=1 Tax=Flavobacterium sp. TaxID=239 RepID=UPI004048486F